MKEGFCCFAASPARFRASAGTRGWPNGLARDSEKARQRLIHGFRRGEGLEYLRLQHNDIAALRELAEVLSAYALAELLSFPDGDVSFNLAYGCSAHNESSSWHCT